MPDVTCDPAPWSQPRWDEPYGKRVRCVCGREFVIRHGDGMRTPPRAYWQPVRRIHLRRYGHAG